MLKPVMITMIIAAVMLLGMAENINPNAGINDDQTEQNMTDDQRAARAVVAEFMRAIDAQEADRVKAVMSTEAQQFFVENGVVSRLAVEPFLGMISGKKIGGHPRQLDIQSSDVNGGLASVKARFYNDAISFDNYFSLMKVGEDWKIICVIVEMEFK